MQLQRDHGPGALLRVRLRNRRRRRLGSDAGAELDAGNDAGGDAGPNWSCMSGPVPPTPTSALLKLFLNDVSSAQSSGSFAGTPIVGASIRSCTALDFACASPLGNGVSNDDAGIVSMTVPGGFDGYYELMASNFTQSILSRPPQLHDESAQQGMASAQLLSLGASAAGVTDDPTLAVVIVSVADCDSNPAPGVTFQVAAPGPKQRIVYIQNNLPTASRLPRRPTWPDPPSSSTSRQGRSLSRGPSNRAGVQSER